MATVEPKTSRRSPAGAVKEPRRGRPPRLTPAWAGRDISLEDFENADGNAGFA